MEIQTGKMISKITKNPRLRRKALVILRLHKILGQDMSVKHVSSLLGCNISDRLIDYVLLKRNPDLVVEDWNENIRDAWDLDFLNSDLE
jgi:hypothetical protein